MSPNASSGSHVWWTSLKHGGLLIAPSHLVQYFPADLPPLHGYLEERLRRDVMRAEDGRAESMTKLLDTVLEHVLGFEDDPSGGPGRGRWLKGSSMPSELSVRTMTGTVAKPRRFWKGPYRSVLPVFVHPDSEVRLGIGRGRRATSEVVEWLRTTEHKIALLTNGRQWRLVYAGLDYDAFVEWDTALWFEEGKAGLQVGALMALLGRQALAPRVEGDEPPLLAAIAASRRGQAELSAALGERVRQAVERLVREYAQALDDLDLGVNSSDIYHAAIRVVMRMVIVLFAEARDLLPRDNPIYHQSYGLHGLREALDQLAGGAGRERLHHRFNAWPRVLSLVRLVYEGAGHEALPVPRYGGDLFRPGDRDSDDPVSRALSVFEDPEKAPDDAAVRDMLGLLCRSRVMIRQGQSSTRVEAPVDFSDLSSEYVGMLYEGLLDFELRRALGDDPVIFLNLGDQPALPLSRLEALDDRAIATLMEKFKEKRKPTLGNKSDADGDENSEEDGAEEDAEPEDERDAENAETDPEGLESADDSDAVDGDVRREASQRALAWAVRAVKAARLVTKPRSPRASALREYEALCEQEARVLVARVALPGEWYLVRWGGTRKGAGTFYTRPQLAVPTVHRTLQPLAYSAPLGPEGPPDNQAPVSRWTPKTPESILALKVCDPACGSGSFLVAALRFLTDALVESLYYHGRITGRGDNAAVALADGHSESGRLSEDLLPCSPDDEGFEQRLRARLKRYVVEICIYGVDIDPLAVELARVALWIETMDPALPFTFLHHKVKTGNSLVGCWFDHFRDYPALAWEREGGDRNHSHGIHFKKDAWSRSIKKHRNDHVKADLAKWIQSTGDQLTFAFADLSTTPEAIHSEATALLEKMHSFAVHESDQRADFYRDNVLLNQSFQRLKESFDIWCAVWFWPPEQLADSPMPMSFADPSEATRRLAKQIAREQRFFHWELEFPDVFTRSGSGFDAILGNPPWEIQKPNSKEFFSNLDPLYRTYGKQEALAKQTEHFAQDPEHERRWLTYNYGLKALSNWVRNAGRPFGDGEEGSSKFSFGAGKAADDLHATWSARRGTRQGYADSRHPFRHQGSADINTYKMFLEQAHSLVRSDGRIGFIVPSGVYTDKGATDLRKLFLADCSWEWLFGFENRDGIFDIHRSFKFCPVIVQKGGSTESIRTAFMHRNLADWEEGEQHAIPYARAQVEQFSPRSRAILEIRSQRDLEILEKIYGNSVLLGDDGPGGWQIQYAREFDMTNDSGLFSPRPWWEARGYRPDEYGRWLKGRWHEASLTGPRWDMDPGVILSVDGAAWIHEDEIEDVALPLYEGRMIGQFDFSQKGWVSGRGRGANWRDVGWNPKTVEPQYLMGANICREARCPVLGWKMPTMNIGSATNSRTVVAAIAKDFPCNHALNAIRMDSLDMLLISVGIFNSWVFDSAVRLRMGGLNLSFFILNEAPAARISGIEESPIIRTSALISLAHKWFSPDWLRLAASLGAERGSILADGPRHWALTTHERLRLRCMLDAVVAELYGLEWDDLSWILRECDYPADRVQDNAFTRTLDPKGFWRVDKNRDPELRHTVLTMAAFRELKELISSQGDRQKGIEAFYAMNGGEGWMLPETLRLADLGLGHDERSEKAQLVRAKLGERFLPWQSEITPEESWKECHLHARNILGADGYDRLVAELAGMPEGVQEDTEWPARAAEPAPSYGVDALGSQLRLFTPGQKDLSGDDAGDVRLGRNHRR